MKFMVVFCILFSVCSAAVIPTDSEATIINYESSNDGTGNYKFRYETSNGITREEVGYLVNAGKEDQHMVVVGSYSYKDVDGKPVLVKYTADENGFHTDAPAPNVVARVPSGIFRTTRK